MAAYISALVFGYLLGSFPSGYIVGKARGVDLRTAGSGNIGATNAVRVLGKKWGALVFLADALKGWLAVMGAFAIAHRLGLTGQPVINAGVVAAIFSVLGHNFPVWLNFKGGKGIAISAGIMLSLFPPAVFLFGVVVWLGLFYSTRYVSIASLGSAVSLPTASFLLDVLRDNPLLHANPVIGFIFGPSDIVRTGITSIMCVMAFIRHRENIHRLLNGTEKRFDKKKK